MSQLDAYSNSDAEIKALFLVARNAIAAQIGYTTVNEETRNSCLHIVNITIYHRGRIRASMTGYGMTRPNAVAMAARRAALDDRFGPSVTLEELAEINLEIWIQHSAEPIAIAEFTSLDLGLYGVDLRLGKKFAYYKPSVALTKAFTNPIRLLEKLAKKAGIPQNGLHDELTELNITSWSHFAENLRDNSILRLRRLRPTNRIEVGISSVKERLRLAQDRLLSIQTETGFYLYQYHPFTEFISKDHVNLVRQAGCAYAMAASAARENDDKRARLFKISASRAVEFLLNFNGKLKKRMTSTAIGYSNLGVIGLTLLAMQFSDLSGKYEEERRLLTSSIVELQNKDGSFRCYTDSTSSVEDGTSQNFFPGEALLALSYEAIHSPSDCKPVIKRAFEWYRGHFRRNPNTAFILWQTDVWRRVFEWQEDSKYADFVFEMVDWLLQFQLNSSSHPEDFIGGFAPTERLPQYSTAAYCEAVIRAYRLARYLQLKDHTESYQRAAKLALCFLFRLQIMPETAYLFSNPVLAVGGTTRSLVDFTLRCDYDQHLITTLLSALENTTILNDG